MKKIFIVTGRAGSWDSTTEWIVGVFETKEDAEHHIKNCLEVALFLTKFYKKEISMLDSGMRLNQYDERMQIIEEGDPHYEIAEHSLYPAPPKFEVSQIVKHAQAGIVKIFRTRAWHCKKRNYGLHKKPDPGCDCENCEAFTKALKTTPY